MPHPTDNPSEPAWKEFTPLQPGAPVTAPPRKPEPSEPYIQQRGGCQFCKSRRFLRSGLRSTDIVSLFLLRYPVRCLRCRQRQSTDFITASLSLAAGSQVYGSASRKPEDWRKWTTGSDREVHERRRNNIQDDSQPPTR
jgi:hypothetical protein